MKQNIILIVDDTVVNLDILTGLLKEYDVIDAVCGKDALEIANEEAIDLILLDIRMPEMSGFDVCQKLKANNQTKEIPIIFITAMDDEDSIEIAYDIGGIDYITKPFKPRELLAKVKRELKMRKLINDLVATQEELKILASTDPMTKLYNRRSFANISKQFLDSSKREKKHLSVIMFDIDRFKKINDDYGHDIGDNVIITVAQKLQSSTRIRDIVCRFGGEEFIVLLPETDLDSAAKIAEKIRLEIEKMTIDLADNNTLNFTISAGVSQVNNLEDINIETSINRADHALYKAKKSGRNQVISN